MNLAVTGRILYILRSLEYFIRIIPFLLVCHVFRLSVHYRSPYTAPIITNNGPYYYLYYWLFRFLMHKENKKSSVWVPVGGLSLRYSAEARTTLHASEAQVPTGTALLYSVEWWFVFVNAFMYYMNGRPNIRYCTVLFLNNIFRSLRFDCSDAGCDAM